MQWPEPHRYVDNDPTNFVDPTGQGKDRLIRKQRQAKAAAFSRLDRSLAALQSSLITAGEELLRNGSTNTTPAIQALNTYYDAYIAANRRGNVTRYPIRPFGLGLSDRVAELLPISQADTARSAARVRRIWCPGLFRVAPHIVAPHL